ncbi:hypothetical protein Hanom_Chr17g01538441 [Helianthus anomalus]
MPEVFPAGISGQSEDGGSGRQDVFCLKGGKEVEKVIDACMGNDGRNKTADQFSSREGVGPVFLEDGDVLISAFVGDKVGPSNNNNNFKAQTRKGKARRHSSRAVHNVSNVFLSNTWEPVCINKKRRRIDDILEPCNKERETEYVPGRFRQTFRWGDRFSNRSER